MTDEKRRRRRVLVSVLAAVVGISAWSTWLCWPSFSRSVPGTYQLVEADGQRSFFVRLSPDGALLRADARTADGRLAFEPYGRWRLSGRTLVLESGAAAAARPGLIAPFVERFQEPILTREYTRFRLISANAAGLTVLMGDNVKTGQPVTMLYERQPDEP